MGVTPQAVQGAVPVLAGRVAIDNETVQTQEVS